MSSPELDAEHNYLLTHGKVHLTLAELSGLLRSVQKPVTPKNALGNPGPLGLGGFALTTMALSIYNAGIITDTSTMVVALALFYGGIAQFVAGLYEFLISNTFGATAFCSYGAFWCSYAGFIYYIVPTLPANKVNEAAGLFLLMWLIFTLYMTVASIRVSVLLAMLFITLSATFLMLVIGTWGEIEGCTQTGGALGILTASLAWYGSAASVINSSWNKDLLPLGLWVRPKPKYNKDNTEAVFPLLELSTIKSNGSSSEEDLENGKGEQRIFLSAIKEIPMQELPKSKQ